MARLRVLLFIGIAALWQPLGALAQPPGYGAMPQQRFQAAPGIGEPLPDLTIVDANGGPVNLREIARGHYTVLVLGCLT